ncbi:hypothetical protein SAMN02745857_03202 [Andreprevotia lacus DSM 23236]|uniref:Lipoprotein n=1 Tax=Andreprevotia lacus DSM 23236 TaxID=1121001 RepID=A0A1W1XWD4_9NEIS|nr:hypothetical protein [Andreprevotia lacus]SMC28300.1 hypothetical protein SAMN02745857_03202 [Andreprevotia lacus DSM 23236]
MNRLALPLMALALALALTGCDEPPAPAKPAQPVVEVGNPILNLPRDQFKTVLGDCGDALYAGKSADEATRTRCYGEIRGRLKSANQPEASDAQLGSPVISERWKFETAKVDASQASQAR